MLHSNVVRSVNAGQLKQHMIKEHKEMREILFPCEICKNTFTEMRILTRHMKSHQ